MKRNDAWWFVAFVLFLFVLLSLLGVMLRVVVIVAAVLVYRAGWFFWVIGIWLNNRAATVRERQGVNRTASSPALSATETNSKTGLLTLSNPVPFRTAAGFYQKLDLLQHVRYARFLLL